MTINADLLIGFQFGFPAGLITGVVVSIIILFLDPTRR